MGDAAVLSSGTLAHSFIMSAFNIPPPHNHSLEVELISNRAGYKSNEAISISDHPFEVGCENIFAEATSRCSATTPPTN